MQRQVMAVMAALPNIGGALCSMPPVALLQTEHLTVYVIF